MTFSILAHDPGTGIFAAGAATGSLCVGGWVLRGDIESGLVASQGTAPSSFWRDDILRRMYQGAGAEAAVRAVTEKDSGRGHRQVIALDRTGATAGFTGGDSIGWAGHDAGRNCAVAGNMLTDAQVLEALRTSPIKTGSPATSILKALRAAQQAGGDMRGLQSAALLILRPDHPPLDLRVDYDPDPIAALTRLNARAHMSPYADWLGVVPVSSDKSRAPGS